jgi:endonuclease/exonuclease/phosphatase family metal-dependent hydrolase
MTLQKNGAALTLLLILALPSCASPVKELRGSPPPAPEILPEPAPASVPGLPETSGENPSGPPEEPSEIQYLYSFNIQIFGTAKMAKPKAAELLADLISGAGLAAVQEVRSLSAEPVETFMALLPDRYGYVLGPRQGRSISKEQYWIIYDREKFTILESDTWADPEDRFERNPLAVYVQSAGAFDFILINNHIKPSGAAEEIAALPEVIAYYRELWGEEDLLIVGDFNADGIYYDESRLEEVFPPGEYHSLITNDMDTTLARGDYTYDRFIISASALEDFAGMRGVIRYDEVYDFEAYGISPRQLSDHYPVWAGFYLDRDTD